MAQRVQPVDPVITYEPLARQLAMVGAQKVLETLASYEASLAHSFPQDDRLATRASKIGAPSPPSRHVYSRFAAPPLISNDRT
jgi:methionyl-tRNA formyltransferase